MFDKKINLKWIPAIFYILVCIIFLLSFYFFASMYYPSLNSDNAVNILMIYYYKFPKDLYTWDLNRFGTLIQLLGQIPFKLFHLSPLISESITRYSILLLGYLSFSTFLKSRFYKIIFAIIWFFPPIRLIDVTQFAYGIHYSLIAMACYLIHLLNKNELINKPVLYHIISLANVIVLILAVWVSDMAIVSVFLIIGIHLFYYLKRNYFSWQIFKNPQLYYLVFGILSGLLFILYAKLNASSRQDYTIFSNLSEIKHTFHIFFKTISDIFLFKAGEPFTGVFGYLVVLIILFVFLNIKKVTINDYTRKWALYFFLDAIILFTVIMVSKWTLLNHVPRRYFTCTYITFAFALLLIIDNLSLEFKLRKILNVILIITVLTAGIGTIFNLKYIAPKTLTPMVKITGEFQKLGKIGIISEYWNSYIVSCTNPDLIKATHHDKTWAVRNDEITDEVFQQDNIYVIKDMWFDTFPDTLKQFGRTLVKDGDEFIIGGGNVCKYRKIK